MTGNPRFAQSIRKLIPGTFSGSYKGAQPVVRALLDRGPVANETEVSGVPCACEAFSGSQGPFHVEPFFTDQEYFEDVCGDAFTIGVTIDNNWTGGFSQVVGLWLRSTSWNAVSPPFQSEYVAEVFSDGGPQTTATQTLYRNGGDTYGSTSGLSKPVIGDRMELLVSGLMAGSVDLAFKWNGATLFTGTDSSPLDTEWETMEVELRFLGQLSSPVGIDVSNFTVAATC